MSNGLNVAQILGQFASVIAAVVATARGNQAARAQVEGLFDTPTRDGWQVVQPIQRIWQGERDESTLTAGIDSNSTLIIREILKQLEN